jgi:hypothetical protein
MFEEVAALAKLRFLNRIGFLMRLPLETERIAVTAELQVINLAVQPVVFVGLQARTGIDGANIQPAFAKYFQGRTAAGSCSHDNHVESVRGHLSPLTFRS